MIEDSGSQMWSLGSRSLLLNIEKGFLPKNLNQKSHNAIKLGMQVACLEAAEAAYGIIRIKVKVITKYRKTVFIDIWQRVCGWLALIQSFGTACASLGTRSRSPFFN